MGPRTPPSARARELGVPLDASFDGVLGCALSVDPNQRYRTVGEFAAAIEGIVSAAGPGSQATMAFPQGAMGMPGAGGYPPPPAPAGGSLRQPSLTAQVPSPYLAQQAAAQAQQPPAAPPAPEAAAGYPGAGPYVSSAQNPQQPQQQGLGETAAGRPIDPAILQQRRPPASRMAPIIVGVVALVLLGGAAAAFIALGRKPPAPVVATTPSSSAVPTDSAMPASSGSAAPAVSGTPAPADSGAPAPADSGTPAPADSAAPDAKPAAPESTLACDPDCDEIKVDDKPIELGKPVVLSAGKHSIVASKAGYQTVKETITVKDGDKVEKTFKLKEKSTPPPPTTPQTNTGPKPCGKFLKRCK
jgi:hypothetical protein